MSLVTETTPDLFIDTPVPEEFIARKARPSEAGAAHRSSGPRTRNLSFVIPVKNERDTLVTLQNQIAASIPDNCRAEIIFIDDGSNDGSWDVIKALTDRNEVPTRGLRFRRNVGKAAALTAGFRAATGDIVFTMDADLQDDPREIPAMLEKLDEGFDIVSGWKKVRNDPWHKVLPSRVFNAMVSRVCGVRLHDHNCGFKCYRAEVTRQLTLHGELHRMVPSLAGILGFRTTEIPVRHHPRRHGVSKYGFERYMRGFFDMLTVGFIRKFGERPSHLMGQVALGHVALSAVLMLVGFVIGIGSALGMTLVVLGAIAGSAATPLLASGLICEMVIRGGLPANWKLPVIEDTAIPIADGSKRRFRQPSVVSLSYCGSGR